MTGTLDEHILDSDVTLALIREGTRNDTFMMQVHE
jgi:hypothetical protein